MVWDGVTHFDCQPEADIEGQTWSYTYFIILFLAVQIYISNDRIHPKLYTLHSTGNHAIYNINFPPNPTPALF